MTAASLLGALWACIVGVWALRPMPGGRRLPIAPPLPGAGAPGRNERVGRLARVAAATTVIGALGLLQPVLLLVAVAGILASGRLRRRIRQRRHDDAVVDQLPDVVDLLRLASQAGFPVAAALAVVRDRPGGPLGCALARSAGMLAQGASTAAALRALDEQAGPTARGLVEALADHDRYGTPLGPVLDRVGLEARHRRRRRAEEAARRLPVTLLFPLVLTTLPAFVLLTVVPLLVSALSSLRP